MNIKEHEKISVYRRFFYFENNFFIVDRTLTSSPFIAFLRFSKCLDIMRQLMEKVSIRMTGSWVFIVEKIGNNTAADHVSPTE